MSSYLVLNWTSFEAPWNVTPCTAPSIPSPLAFDLSADSKSPDHQTLLGNPGQTSIDAILILKGTRICIPQSCSIAPLWTCMEHIKGLIGCKLRWERLFIGPADADIVDMSASTPFALSTKPLQLHSQCFLEISLIVHGSRLLPATSATRVKSIYWYVICSASTLSCIRSPQNQPNPYVCTCKSSSHSMDHLVCSTLTMACPLHLKSLHSSCSATVLVI